MSSRTSEIIQIIISNVIHSEQQLESIKLQMAQQNLYSLQPIFQRLDQNRQGYIDTQDLISFFEDNDMQLTSRQAYFIIKWMDKDCDGQLTFQDLCNCLLPKDNYRQRVVTALREPYYIDQNMYLPFSVEKPLAFYFSQLANFIDLHQKLKEQLKALNYNAYSTFAQISNNQSHINIEQLANYFNIPQEQLKYFFQAADLNQDGLLSQQEFIELTLNVDQQNNFNFNQIESTLNVDQYIDHSNSGQSTPERPFLKVAQQEKSPLPQKVNSPKNEHESSLRFSFNKQSAKTPEREYKQIQKPTFVTPQKKDKAEDYHNYIQTINRQKEQQKSIQFAQRKQIETKSDIIYVLEFSFSFIFQQYYSFFKFVLKQILATREMEELKKQLALRQDFNMLDAFRLIDKNFKGHISVQDIQNSYKSMHISQYDLNGIGLIIKQYGRNQQNLSFDEFNDMILLFASDYKTLLENRAPSYIQQDDYQAVFSEKTLEIYKQLIENIIQNLKHLNELKKEIVLTAQEIFQFLDRGNKGYINQEDFREFLLLFDVHPTAQELRRAIIMYGNEEQISEVEFKKELMR